MIRRIDRYELLEEVGSGGMAVVYRGRDTTLEREVAIKVLHPHLAAKLESRARFSREAKAVARLSHPNILEIFDYAGDDAKESYLVMEESNAPQEWNAMFSNIENNFAPWKFSPEERDQWAQNL